MVSRSDVAGDDKVALGVVVAGGEGAGADDDRRVHAPPSERRPGSRAPGPPGAPPSSPPDRRSPASSSRTRRPPRSPTRRPQWSSHDVATSPARAPWISDVSARGCARGDAGDVTRVVMMRIGVPNQMLRQSLPDAGDRPVVITSPVTAHAGILSSKRVERQRFRCFSGLKLSVASQSNPPLANQNQTICASLALWVLGWLVEAGRRRIARKRPPPSHRRRHRSRSGPRRGV